MADGRQCASDGNHAMSHRKLDLWCNLHGETKVAHSLQAVNEAFPQWAEFCQDNIIIFGIKSLQICICVSLDVRLLRFGRWFGLARGA
jgi:hypothetical protein